MKKIVIISLTLVFIGIYSCDEEELALDNPNAIPTSNFYQTGEQAESAVNAIYAALQTNGMYKREYFYVHDLLSDEYQIGGGLEAQRIQVLDHTFDSSNPLIKDLWNGLYRVVQRSNLVLENVPNVPAEGLSQELKERFLGEARFLRAFALFDLVSLWGEIPLQIKVPDPSGSQGEPLSPEQAVYDVIFNDLEIAINNLPINYDNSNLGRVTKGAAQALVAKVHMFRGDVVLARPFLEEVINSGVYSLVANYGDNFTIEGENNSESVFEVQFSGENDPKKQWDAVGTGLTETTFRGQEYSPIGWRNVKPSDSLVADFEENDPRFKASFYENGDLFNNAQDTIGGQNTPATRKYTTAYFRDSEQEVSSINFRVIRYADVLLMMAEVENELSGPAAALPFINQVRARVEMPAYPTTAFPFSNQQEAFEAIVHERRVELNQEQVRNRDIRRWRRQGKLAIEPIKVFQPRNNFLPLPISEINNNQSLDLDDQKPGY